MATQYIDLTTDQPYPSQQSEPAGMSRKRKSTGDDKQRLQKVSKTIEPEMVTKLRTDLLDAADRMIRAYEANQVENEELRRKFSTLEREYELLKEASESERTNFRENTMIKQSQQIQALKEEVERLGGLRHKLEDDQQSLKDYHDQAMADVKTKIANLTQALADKNERLRGVVEERDRALHKLERHRETVATARELIKANEGVLHAADNFRKTIED